MKVFLRGVCMMALLRLAAGMLMPEGANRRICDMMLGLMTMLGMISAMRELLLGWIG